MMIRTPLFGFLFTLETFVILNIITLCYNWLTIINASLNVFKAHTYTFLCFSYTLVIAITVDLLYSSILYPYNTACSVIMFMSISILLIINITCTWLHASSCKRFDLITLR